MNAPIPQGWTKNERGEITRTYPFKNFSEALIFANAVGYLAEKANHHPDMLVQWGKVTLNLISHDKGELTSRDFDLANQIDTTLLQGAKRH